MKNLTLIFALLFCLLGLQQQTHAQTRQADSLALVMLYDSTDGANWTRTWDLTMPMSSWNGVTLTGGRVTVVVLYNNNLIGTLPDLNLRELTWFNLDYNQLTGSIPNFTNLINLTQLALNNNQLTGSIPTFPNLSNLTELSLGGNQLTGSIPNFTNLINLTELNLSSNQLTGSIPTFPNLSNLTELRLNNNQLTGSIPTFANLINLTQLSLGGNQLTGSIPTFPNLSNLTELRLNNNQLTGSIPTFPNLTNLTELNLSSNQLTGSIPTFPNLSNLTELELRYNQLTGSIPTFPNLPNLTVLSLGHNQLTGSIPNFANLPNLTVLFLDGNQLTGSIPNFANLPNLTQLALNNNQLTGSIPTFANLTYLSLYSNQLTGSIPNFANLTNLTQLYLYDNQLTFSDFLPNYSTLSALSRFRYAPQDSIGTAQTISVATGSSYTIDLVIDDTVTTNTYYWYKDGTLIDSTFGVNEYTISNFQASDIGVYTASITNSIVTNPNGFSQNLILYSRPIMLDMGLSISQTQSIPTLQVQPNPVSDLLYINTQAVQGDYLVSLIDMQGRVVEQLQGSGSTVFRLSMAQQPAGIYIVRMQQADKVWQQKVVKQ